MTDSKTMLYVEHLFGVGGLCNYVMWNLPCASLTQHRLCIFHFRCHPQLQAAMQTAGAGDFKLTWTTSPEKESGGRAEERYSRIL